jgi:hypothetical protein
MVDKNEPGKMNEDEVIDLTNEVIEPEEDDAIIDLTEAVDETEKRPEMGEIVDLTEPVEEGDEEIIELTMPIEDDDAEEQEIELNDIVRETPAAGFEAPPSPVFEEVPDNEPPDPTATKIIEEVIPTETAPAVSSGIEIGEPIDESLAGEVDDDAEEDVFADSLGMDIYDDEPEPAEEADAVDAAETISLTSEQVEAAVERVLLRILPEKIEGILVETIERIVTQEIQKIKNDLLD